MIRSTPDCDVRSKGHLQALSAALPPPPVPIARADRGIAPRGAVSCPSGGMSIDTVVFLDIDGVCHQVDDPRGPFRPRCMVQLKKLIHGSDASICLSSSWRESDWGREQVDKYLAAHDMPAVISCTPLPEEGYNTRADEILSWCVAAPPPCDTHVANILHTREPKVRRPHRCSALARLRIGSMRLASLYHALAGASLGRLQRHPEVTHWVVLDDLDLTWDDSSAETPAVMAARFVQTDPDQGMTAQDAERALEILAQPCTLPLPPPRRAGEAEEPPSVDPLVDGVAGMALERDASGTIGEGREGYSGF